LGARPLTAELKTDAGKAFDRALELDPALGEAWAQRGRLTKDPAEADAMYRRAIALAPGFDESYVRYADFLFTERRRGEAMDLIDRARRIDPSSATLCVLKSQLLISTHADVDGQQRELRQALIINPGYPTAMRELARSDWMLRGNFAEAIQLVERSLAIDRASDRGDWIAVGLYLDIGEAEAAKSVLRNTRRPDDAGTLWPWIWIALFEEDQERSGRFAHEFYDAALKTKPGADAVRDDKRTYSLSQELYGYYDYAAIALRDEALASGNFSYALDRLGQMYEWRAGTSAIRSRGLGLTYASTLLLAGETKRARGLLAAMLRAMDAEQTGRPKNWFAWERASAYAMLGEGERALTELASSLEMNRYNGWWYMAERDPVFNQIRPDPRFQSLAARARKHQHEQRGLLDETRRKGAVPKRS
jgi:tetratricopeptide (TPR) repeat protein